MAEAASSSNQDGEKPEERLTKPELLTKLTRDQLEDSSKGPSKTGLRIAHLNVNGLCTVKKMKQIKKEVLRKQHLHILAITEAKLTPKHDPKLGKGKKALSQLREKVKHNKEIAIKGYRFERFDREIKNQEGQGGGGVVIYIRNDIVYTPKDGSGYLDSVKKDAPPPQYIHISVGTVNVVAAYFSPSNTWKKAIRNNLLCRIGNDEKAVILGDFNIDLAEDYVSEFQYGFHQLIENYTRIEGNSSTLIDHIYTNNVDMILESGVVRYDISDHDLIYCTVKSPARLEDDMANLSINPNSDKRQGSVDKQKNNSQSPAHPPTTASTSQTQVTASSRSVSSSAIVSSADSAPDQTESATKSDGKKTSEGEAGDGSVRPKDSHGKK